MARIEDYALLGDLQTAALVERGGSIDWLCFPRFDSGACFAALLGNEENGRWLLSPSADATSTRRYLHDTLVLETTWKTEDGAVARVFDFMPPRIRDDVCESEDRERTNNDDRKERSTPRNPSILSSRHSTLCRAEQVASVIPWARVHIGHLSI